MYGKSRRTHRREAFVPQHHPCRIPGTNTWQAGIKNGLNYYFEIRRLLVIIRVRIVLLHTIILSSDSRAGLDSEPKVSLSSPFYRQTRYQ